IEFIAISEDTTFVNYLRTSFFPASIPAALSGKIIYINFLKKGIWCHSQIKIFNTSQKTA
ncbi:MAG: hypothetical protein OEU95_00385, partial [Nitrospirota bacterium]|nr:hypothetical protein [Nitrospirota bacterium]